MKDKRNVFRLTQHEQVLSPSKIQNSEKRATFFILPMSSNSELYTDIKSINTRAILGGKCHIEFKFSDLAHRPLSFLIKV